MLRILDADEEFLMGMRDNMLVAVWGRVTVERLRRATVGLQSVAADLEKGGFGSLVIIMPRRMDLSDAIEQQAGKLAEIGAASVLASAVVIEGDGGLAQFARTVAKTLQFTRNGKLPEQFFRTVDDAASWIVPQVAPRTGHTFTASDLSWDIAAARAEHR
jgi:hypothetical protein